ncbi:MAG TPA: dihydrolipoamide acetyltransferase family protein [Puia sp.]|jgi:2-oxoglutarate dehydrogenase E2 component (dihydrolipoamide succinyltransferase)
MAIVDLLMPKMGESIMEATILKWNKQPGESVQQDESLLEIATDKVDSEVPSTAAGILTEILFPVDAVVPVGAIIAKIETNGSSTLNAQHTTPDADQKTAENEDSPATNRQPPTEIQQPPTVNRQLSTENVSAGNGQRSAVNENRFYSPLVLNIASNEGINLSELEKIQGTGNEGRVTKKDILQYVSKRKDGNGFHSQPPVTEPVYGRIQEKNQTSADEKERTQESIPVNMSGNVEIQEMDRMRKLVAEHMVRSKQTSPHVTSFTEADVTNLVLWREKEKDDFEKREGTKLTLTPLFIEAVIKCIKKYPLINSSLQGDKIIIKKDINIGMATALPTGNLIVPVIKTADNYNRIGLARQVNTLAQAARNNKLKPGDIQDGTFTITNVGVFGSLMGTPIINQPQVAILAVGAIKKRPMVIESDQGDSIGIRHMMYLSMSYDHRIIDGSLGATFLTAVANELEGFQP